MAVCVCGSDEGGRATGREYESGDGEGGGSVFSEFGGEGEVT